MQAAAADLTPVVTDDPAVEALFQDVARALDADTYHAAVRWGAGGAMTDAGPHTYVLSAAPGSETFAFTSVFTPKPAGGRPPGFDATASAARAHWNRFWSTGGAIDLAVSDAGVFARWLERCLVAVRRHEANVGIGAVVLGFMLDDQFDAVADESLKVELVELQAGEVASHELFEVSAECCFLVEARRVSTAPDAEAAVVLFVHDLSLEDEPELIFLAVLCHAFFHLGNVHQHGLNRPFGFWVRGEVALFFLT
jgi:hypothetical protein